jgi:hypothetical protein
MPGLFSEESLSAKRKLALQTLYALALMPRVPEGTSAWFGASAGILAAGPVETIIPKFVIRVASCFAPSQSSRSPVV